MHELTDHSRSMVEGAVFQPNSYNNPGIVDVELPWSGHLWYVIAWRTTNMICITEIPFGL
jgi:hypothetical protein